MNRLLERLGLGLVLAAPLVLAADPPPAAKPDPLPPLGTLSKRYEVGTGGPETISSGVGDRGGVSYGTYQLNSRTVQRFVDSHYAAEFKGLKPGTAPFGERWTELATKDREAFGRVQHEYIKATHYDPAVEGIAAALKLDVTTRSRALQDVTWSTAVQHGAGGAVGVFKAALAGERKDGSAAHVGDDAIIRAVYAERGRKDDTGGLVRFKGNSEKVQRGVAARFVSEQRDALKMLEAERMRGRP